MGNLSKLVSLFIGFGLALALSACAAGGKHQPLTALLDDRSQEPDGTTNQPLYQDGLPALPGPGSALNRKTVELGFVDLNGVDFLRAAASTLVIPDTGSCVLSGDAGQPGWAMYEFQGLTPHYGFFTLSLSLGEDLPSRLWVASSDYEGHRWRWQQIENPTAEQGVIISNSPKPQNLSGSLFCVVLVDAGQQASLESLRLDQNAVLPPPTGLSASRGTSPGRIDLVWDNPASVFPGLQYTKIIIERSTSSTIPYDFKALAELPAGTTNYYDVHDADANAIPYNTDVLYRLRFGLDDLVGPPGYAVTGIRLLGPVTGLYATMNEYNGGDRIRVLWYTLLDASAYRLEYRNADGGEPADWTYLTTVPQPVVYFDHTAANPPGKGSLHRTSYEYRVKGLFGVEYDASPEWSSVVAGRRELFAPIGLTASAGQSANIELNWIARNPAIGYNIYRDGTDAAHKIGASTEPTFIDAEAADNFPHVYYVQSTAGTDASSPSEGEIGYTTRCTMHDVPDDFAPDDIVAVAGRPAFAGFGAGHDSVYYASAGIDRPEDLDDWQVTLAFDPGPMPVYGVSLAEYDGKPAIAWRNQISLNLLLANTTDPASPADWTNCVVAQYLPGQSGVIGMKLAVVAGRPAMSLVGHEFDEYTLQYAAALVALPQSESDWQMSIIRPYDSGFESYSISAPAELGGTPAMITAGEQELSYHFSSAPVPDSSSDWNHYVMLTAEESPYYVRADRLLAVNDKPHCIVLHEFQAMHWYATESQPQAATNWSSYVIASPFEGGVKNIASGIINGRLVFKYELSPDIQSRGFYALRSALLAEPISSQHWSIECLLPAKPKAVCGAGGVAQILGSDKSLGQVLLRLE